MIIEFMSGKTSQVKYILLQFKHQLSFQKRFFTVTRHKCNDI